LPGKARASSALPPVGAVVMPPWTNLALSGASMQTRGAADPLLTRESLASTARLCAGGHDPRRATRLGYRRSEFTWAKTKLSLTSRCATASVSRAVSGTVYSWEAMTNFFHRASLFARPQGKRSTISATVFAATDPRRRRSYRQVNLTKRSAGRIEGLR
jgi:acetyl esterase/lipase